MSAKSPPSPPPVIDQLPQLLRCVTRQCQRARVYQLKLEQAGFFIDLQVVGADAALLKITRVGVAEERAEARPNADGLKLRRIHRCLLTAAGPGPIPAKKLISLTGYPVNTYSRSAITQLCRAGLLVRTADGVHLPPGSQEPAR